MTQREDEIDFLEAQGFVEQEWQEFLSEYLGERAQGIANGTANQRDGNGAQGAIEGELPGGVNEPVPPNGSRQ